MEVSKHPSTIPEVIAECDTSKMLPELHKLLVAAVTFPVSNATSERMFSVLKRVKTCFRSTMGQGRLSNISVLNIEKDMLDGLDYDDVLDKFAAKARKVELQRKGILMYQ